MKMHLAVCNVKSRANLRRFNRRRILGMLVVATLCGCQQDPLQARLKQSPPTRVRGIVWQLDDQTLHPMGNWERLGARELLIQWTAVDGINYLPGAEGRAAARFPDWQRIAAEPWANKVIVGLAGRFDETAARANVAALIEESRKLAALPTPLHVAGWFFPLEVDSSWSDAARLGPLLAALPRPLWISVYDSANVGADTLSQWLASWLPPDVGIFFQDGVGIHAREASVARHYADVLAARFGKQRVRIIAEAFRPRQGGGFRPATAAELKPQLAVYDGFSVYLFDGPHYLNRDLVNELAGPENAAENGG
ncbi:hypothetical protein V8G57_24495 [Collimonas sp. H4R21]|uniref:Uncharacterized protein n=2 Tax=Oxalobacteraceae TaxID=75682 RepID=A0ABU9Q2Z1_9BURK|nr:hypothetical protein [Collimonas sp. OK412]SFD16243.1 hypothetical protein SAMN04515619_1277 [Collimonas sp. OK412]